MFGGGEAVGAAGMPGIGGLAIGTPIGLAEGKLGPIDGLGCPKDGVDPEGAGETGVGLVAASIAFILASLSPLSANIIPERIPVKNVEIGINISKNFWSIGDIALSGCVTNIIE